MLGYTPSEIQINNRVYIIESEIQKHDYRSTYIVREKETQEVNTDSR